MRIIRVMLCSVLVLSAAAACTKAEKPINDPSLFVTKNTGSSELPSYGCVRLRRGDRIELTGTVSGKKAGGKEILTTSAGRKFILTGEKADLSPGVIYQVKSVITFEGNDEQLPELSILSFKPVKKP